MTPKLDDEEVLGSFLKAQSIPLVDELSADNFMNYAESGLPLAYLFSDPDSKDLQTNIDSIKTLAKTHKASSTLSGLTVSSTLRTPSRSTSSSEDWPAFAIQDIEQNLKFPLEDLSGDLLGKVTDFVSKYTSGSLKPSVKSEPIPKDQDGPRAHPCRRSFEESSVTTARTCSSSSTLLVRVTARSWPPPTTRWARSTRRTRTRF